MEITPMDTRMGRAFDNAMNKIAPAGPEVDQIVSKWRDILVADDFVATLDPAGGQIHIPLAALPEGFDIEMMFPGFEVVAEEKPFVIVGNQTIEGILITYKPEREPELEEMV